MLPILSREKYEEHRAKNIRIYAYLNRIADKIMMPAYDLAGCALFDADGCLLKVHGSEAIRMKLENQGICRGSHWQIGTVGQNAVTLGLLKKCTMTTIGVENRWDVLKQYAIYVSPLNVYDPNFSDGNSLMGGVAIFVPVEHRSPAFQMAAIAISSDLVLHLFIGKLYYRLLDVGDRSLIACNINVKNKFFRKHIQNTRYSRNGYVLSQSGNSV